ncbi:kinase-like domain-containing protein [Vararia minispora EC-137]|uniref:Kinase-like domain-containing protein n=1 Tax=Vararia minispora EC-137 TaxID=1314806 RepID=A0ACB8QTP6_9AGAM|nr:kinase-like domain-containing protein [Vararia minispora EC-137]
MLGSAPSIACSTRLTVRYYAFRVIGLPEWPDALAAVQIEATTHWIMRDHPHILAIHRTFIEWELYFLVFDFVPGGSILDAVAHCHEKGIARCDLKPENILDSEDGLSYFLSNFGLSTTKRRCSSRCTGSKPFQAPECIDPRIRDDYCTYELRAAEIWSLGIALITMLVGRYPSVSARASEEHFAAYLINPVRMLCSHLPVTPECMSLLMHMLEVDPD